MTLAALTSYNILYQIKEWKSKNEKLEFFAKIKNNLIQLITYKLYNTCPEEPLEILRQAFQFYAENEDFYIEGIKFFCLFPEFIKSTKFNSIKAFLFYLAYMAKRYDYPEVKELLEEKLIIGNFTIPSIYLELCMYCFYKGIYYIERKDFFMASYLYTVPLSMGLKFNEEDTKVFNEFSLQMLRTLCFLKCLTNFDIATYLFKDFDINYRSELILILSIKEYGIGELLKFLHLEKITLNDFEHFYNTRKELFKDNKLTGLYNEAKEQLIFNEIKEKLSMYKRIKMTKLAQISNVEFKEIMKVMKKKVMEGEINIKYNELTDEIEVLNVDPGLNERVEKTKEFYKQIIEANKNLFSTIKEYAILRFAREEDIFNEKNNDDIEIEN